MKYSTLLAIDSATGPSSVAVWKNGSIAAYAEDTSTTMQSARLIPLIEQVLKESQASYSELSAIACTTGPGSFTGIRVALAAARGICFAAKLPGLGFTTLEVIASAAKSSKPVLAALNAGKGEYYYQAFDNGPLFEPRVGTLEAAQQAAPGAILIGNAPGSTGHPFPRADALAELAATKESASALEPFYIRPPDAIPNVKNF